jgi:hypothetical protein
MPIAGAVREKRGVCRRIASFSDRFDDSFSTRAWTWLHKLRRAMVRPGRDRLSGQVEVDESLVGGAGGAQGRSTATKALIVIAAEEMGHAIGRIRLRRIPASRH